MGPGLHQCRGPPFGTRVTCMRTGVLDLLNQEVGVWVCVCVGVCVWVCVCVCVCVCMGAWVYVVRSSVSLFFVIMLFISLEKPSLNVR